MSLRTLCIVGTRPEAIKLAPVISGLYRAPGVESRVCATAQHREMLDQILDLFAIKPDIDLNLMEKGQDLYSLTGRVIVAMRDVLEAEAPDVVIVQGDTTTCFASTLAAFYAGIPVAHVEAGLRTGDLSAPFPEEANRALVGRLARLHFAPTEWARGNLLAENVADGTIQVTGNTVIDALLEVRGQVEGLAPSHWHGVIETPVLDAWCGTAGRRVLITGHRRENFGRGFEDLCNAIRDLAQRYPDWQFVYPVHLNPNVQGPVRRILSGLGNVHLLEPLDYQPFVWLMNGSDLILTDSGGIQEEAPSLGKPVLVMRDVTERPEAVEAGTVKLVGTDRAKIVGGVESVLLDQDLYERMSKAHNPYGDGRAAGRIVRALMETFGGVSSAVGGATSAAR
ncbi:MAG: UDP-N-acetylglucosamine 2-epimerase (non-hydrolyzing) [Alphaproteobacteria bacterium]|nr:UDP-N-acetylglucosamine 2-epimerase (non-hydrolyzing) [Alphaproteobacteria bacterium]